MKQHPPFFPTLPPQWLALAILPGLFLLSSCGEKEQEATISAPKTPTEPQGSIVVLPPSGEITTSAGTPSTAETPQLTPQQQNKMLNVMIDRLKDQQAKGLGTGVVRVNAAWHYDGYSYLSPNPDAEIPARMVAVDVTVKGHTSAFDPDDIEIIDGVTMVSYGSDPHITFIKAPGELIENASEIPVAPAETRMLLIYAFPRNTQKFTLYYWGQNLLNVPRGFDESGWGLPYPEKSETAN